MNNRNHGWVNIDAEGNVTSDTVSGPGFDNDYYPMGLFHQNSLNGSGYQGFWSSERMAATNVLAGWSQTTGVSNTIPTALTPMGGITDTAPNIIQPTTNVTMPARGR